MILEDVPENEVCQNIRNIMAAGWEHITLDKQSNGKWTIRAR